MAVTSENSAKSVRFGLRKLFVVVAVIAVLCWGVHAAKQALDFPFQAYATWDGANLVIQHLYEHEGRWPNGWDELEATWEKRQGRTRGGQSIDELKRRLTIDFEVDVESFASAPATIQKGLPQVIRLNNGRETYWEGAEPNELIHRYLTDSKNYLMSADYWGN
jgi:hypothetical protein